MFTPKIIFTYFLLTNKSTLMHVLITLPTNFLRLFVCLSVYNNAKIASIDRDNLNNRVFGTNIRHVNWQRISRKYFITERYPFRKSPEYSHVYITQSQATGSLNCHFGTIGYPFIPFNKIPKKMFALCIQFVLMALLLGIEFYYIENGKLSLDGFCF